MSTVSENLQSILNSKYTISAAIINKGQDLTGIPLSGYAAKIEAIQTGGSSGPFSLFKVKSYIPAAENILTLSTYFNGTGQYSEIDYRQYSGTYQVTPQTAELIENNRIYKHTAQNYWIKYIIDQYDGSYWCLVDNLNASLWSSKLNAPYNYKSLVEGTTNWSSFDMGGQIPTTLSNFNIQHVDPRISGYIATNYYPATKTWDVESTLSSLSQTEIAPILNCIYTKFSNSLIGEKIAIGWLNEFVNGKLAYQDAGGLSINTNYQTSLNNWNALTTKSHIIQTTKFDLNGNQQQYTQVQHKSNDSSVRMQGQIYFNATGIWKIGLRNDDNIAIKIGSNTTIYTNTSPETSQRLSIDITQIGWYDFDFLWQNGSGDYYYFIYYKSPTDSDWISLPTSMVRCKNI